MSLIKLWFLHSAAQQAECGESFLGRLVGGGFVLLDVALVLILWGILWKSYQIKLIRPLAQVAETMRQGLVHRGPGSTERSSRAGEEIQELAQATNALVKQSNALITQAREVGRAMLETSQAAFSTSKQQATLLAEHASSSGEMASALRELVLTAQQISAEGHAVLEVASRTEELAEQGQRAVMNVVQSMDEIRQAFQRSADQILAMGKRSEHINDAAAAIDRMIADTTLIAFNATIEAARAREEGRGFGVVALEIKRLAEEVCESTEDMKEVIQEIQGASHALALATEEEMKTVSRGALLAEEAGDSLTQIVAMVKLTTESAQRIASATQQQKNASEQVLQAVETANHSTRRLAQESKYFAVAAAELSLLAEGLRQFLAGFGAQ